MGPVKISCGIVSGRLVAFDEDLGVCFNVSRRGRTVFHTGKVTVSAKSADGKVQWSLPPGDMNVDDLVVTAEAVCCVGHYEGGGRPAELRVISRRDGKVLATYEIDGFPAYNGVSAAGNKLFISTRDGRLICFEGK